MEVDYQFYNNAWGNNICFTGKNLLDVLVSWNDTEEDIGIYGHHPSIPRVGQTIFCECENSFIKFEFTEIERCSNPRDMFFGKVKPIDQVMK